MKYYTVTNRATSTTTLVHAASKNAAIRAVAASTYDCRVASQDDIVSAMKANEPVVTVAPRGRNGAATESTPESTDTAVQSARGSLTLGGI